MSKTMRIGAVSMALLMVLALGTPTVLADGAVVIDVTQGDTDYTVTVSHNESAVNDSSVTVEPTDPANSSYFAEGTTDENGTVTFQLPDNETEVNITATFDDHEHTEMFVLNAASEDDGEPAWEGDGPFGQWVSTIVKGLLAGNTDAQLGQTIADLVTKNNPGADKRADKANPGGNGPPEHAGPSGDDDRGGPPDHAGSDDDGDEDDGEDDDGDEDDGGSSD